MPNVNKGKKIVISTIVVLLLIELIITVFLPVAPNANLDASSTSLVKKTVRFLFMGAILFFLYKGYKWAKWIIAILLLISGVGTVLSLFAQFNWSMLTLGSVYLLVSITLIKSSAVQEFLSYQRN